MSESAIVEGRMAPLRIDNLDIDQIMPKQFLWGIDKSGLAKGVLYDLRFDPQGQTRADFVLNRPEHADTSVLVAGSDFGCGSSREHAVWGLHQFGIRAVSERSFATLRYGRLNSNYQGVHALARLIVRHLTFAFAAGQHEAPAFLVDMDKVFQEYLTRLI